MSRGLPPTCCSTAREIFAAAARPRLLRRGKAEQGGRKWLGGEMRGRKLGAASWRNGATGGLEGGVRADWMWRGHARGAGGYCGEVDGL